MEPAHGAIERTDRLRVYIRGRWVPLRWWQHGQRIRRCDLSEDEREARAIYLHRRYIVREGRGDAA